MPTLQQAPELRQQLQTTFYDEFIVSECISNPLYQPTKIEIRPCAAFAGSAPILLLLQCWRVHACTPASTRAKRTILNHLLRWICRSRIAFQILCSSQRKSKRWSCSAFAGSSPILVLLQCWRAHACTPAGTRAKITTPNRLLRWICCSRMHFKSSVAADEIRNLAIRGMLSFCGL